MIHKYKMFNAPSSYTIECAASLGMNWVIVHSIGLSGQTIGLPSFISYDLDMMNRKKIGPSGQTTDIPYPIYFEDYPKVAEVRRYQDAVWIEPLKAEVTALCDQANRLGLKVAFHLYEPTIPLVFEQEYPEIVGICKRQTQGGTVDVHSHLDPDNPITWQLMRSKYAEIARTFPKVDMMIISTWDGEGSNWCIPKSKMPIHRRIVKQVESALEGVRSVRKDCQICLRLWGRNWPSALYRDGHRLIEELTGVKDATEYMQPVAKVHNDPDVILPKLFAELPKDVPIMYKSTRMDIHDAQPLTYAAGTYPKDREQIIEVSYELYHQKPWPWCKVKHIRLGLEAAANYNLAGFLALSVNMGNNDRNVNPETGNLGRMNTWFFEHLMQGDNRTDIELTAAWLEKEFGSPQPKGVVELLLEANDIVDKGIQWGNGVWIRQPFASLHTMKLNWMFDGFIDSEFPYKMAKPTKETIEGLIEMKHKAYDRALLCIAKIKAMRAGMHQKLYEEMLSGFTMLADFILLSRDWQSYILMQYGIERGVYPATRVNLGRMSRFVENFICHLIEKGDTQAVKHVITHIEFPDKFALT
ncbi:MAG: hypothetical protein ABIE74_09000 [Pseudomonadota bacterium]